jgi:glyoxalase family protein
VGGVHHVALGVSDEAVQLKWKRHLVDNGVAVSGPYDRGWFSSIYFSDPDGQILELATAGPGYDLDESIDQLGQVIALPKPAQLRGQRDEAAIAAATHPDAITEIEDEMRIDGIHHVTGITNDVEAIGAFYTRALGLALVKRSVNQDDPGTPHLFWANYEGTRVAPHSTITQFGWPRSDYFARPGAGQTDYVAFRAGSADDLQMWETHLHTAGIETTPIVAEKGQAGLSFVAPDGLRMKLATG